jgi:Domain of unknown function (DUF6438)
MRLLTLTAALFLTIAAGAQAQSSKSAAVPDDLSIILQRTFCLGVCPVYKLEINAAGVVTFDGIKYTEKIGPAKGEISKEKIKQLVEIIEKIDFFSLQDSYDQHTCEIHMTDQPSQIISVSMNGKHKAVLYDLGCVGQKTSNELSALTELGRSIDDLTGSERWTRIKKK